MVAAANTGAITDPRRVRDDYAAGIPVHRSAQGDTPLLGTSAVSVFAGFGLIAALGLGWTLARSTAGIPPFSIRPSMSAGARVAAAPALHVVATDLKFDAKQLTFAGLGPVKVQLENRGVIEHDFSIDGMRGKAYAGPKKTGEGMFQFSKPGTYAFYCSIPGHKEAGMAGMLTVSAGKEQLATGVIDSKPALPSAAAHVTHATVVSTQRAGNQVLEPKIVDGVKVFELTARAVKWEVFPGVFEEAWTYNDQLPGPLLRVTEGDMVRIMFKNELPEESVIHLHGPRLPNAMDGVPDVTQPTVKVGQSFTYEFTAEPSGTFIYHSHHNSAVQEPKGLYGMFIVDPKPGSPLAQRDAQYGKDVVQVLGEFEGHFVINGKAFPATESIQVKVGEKVRIRLANLGQAMHPMHLHGYHFKIVGTDGNPVEGPPLVKDTISIGPGERYDLEFVADNPGTWVFHCHILSHVANKGVEPGGMITVIQVT